MLTLEALIVVVLLSLLLWRMYHVLTRFLRLWKATRDGAKIQWPNTVTRISAHSKARVFRRFR